MASPPLEVLLIEDDREAASYLMQALDEAGHVTHHASDGETGYEAIVNNGSIVNLSCACASRTARSASAAVAARAKMNPR